MKSSSSFSLLTASWLSKWWVMNDNDSVIPKYRQSARKKYKMAKRARLSVLRDVMISGWPSDWAADSIAPVSSDRSRVGQMCHPCALIPSFTVPSLNVFTVSPYFSLSAMMAAAWSWFNVC